MALKATAKEAKALQRQIHQMTIEGVFEDVTPKKARQHIETDEQILLFDKRELMQDKHPDLRRLYATLNGVYIPPALLKPVRLSGLTKGVLDVKLEVPRTIEGVRYSGCVLDMKTATGRPTPEQLDWAKFYAETGWRSYFCGGVKGWFSPWQEAWLCLCHYLGFYEPPVITDEDKYTLKKMGRDHN